MVPIIERSCDGLGYLGGRTDALKPGEDDFGVVEGG